MLTEISKPEYYKMPRSFSVDSRRFTVNYLESKYYRLPNTNRTLTEIKDLSIAQELQSNSPQQKSLAINEEATIVLSVSDGLWGYFHMIYNVLGEIDAIQNSIPSAKIKILFFCNEENFKIFFKKIESLGILSAYGISESDIIKAHDYDVIKIKTLFLIHSEYNILNESILNNEFFFRTSFNGINDWSQLVSIRMKKRFGVSNVISGNKKIFISNLKGNDWNRKISDILKKKINEEDISKEDLILVQGIKEDEYREYIDRPMEKEEEEKLEQMFELAGYDIVRSDTFKSIFDAAQIFGSATKIVSLIGGGLVNTCFSSKKAKVLILNNSDLYRFPHKEIVKSFGVDCVDSPYKKPWNKQTYDANEIFESVKKSYPEFLSELGV